jgi:hypothetical protein
MAALPDSASNTNNQGSLFFRNFIAGAISGTIFLLDDPSLLIQAISFC